MCFGLVFILFALYICASSSVNNGPRAVSSLKFLLVVSKHGARAPTHTYPRDPFRDRSLWPEGPGHITRVGKRQMYSVGEKLRHLYDGFLSGLYQNSKVMIQSTLVDRTVMSAATLLAGLYPPQGHQLWHTDIFWQPIAIYPNLLDKSLLTLDPRHCPRYWMEQNNSVAVLSENDSQHADIYQAISQGSGRNLTTCSHMYLLYHNLAAMIDNGLLLPKWAEEIFQPRMLPVVSEMVRNTTLKNVKMIKILNGLYLRKILDLFLKRTQPQTDPQTEDLSMFLHVGHDITIMCLLAALGFSEVHIPWSSTTLLFELHYNPALPSKHQVQVLKFDGRTNSSIPELLDMPELLEMPICKSPCDLSTFVAHTEKYTTRDWQLECRDMTSPSDS